MLREFCAENRAGIGRALAMGASRIELCDNLAVGGTTPSYGVIESVSQLATESDASVAVMIRPRGGDFYYEQEEVSIMLSDIAICQHLGVQGVVFGALDDSNWLDEGTLERLIGVAEGLEIVFHMAFDHIPRSRQLEAIDWLAARGVTRVLTHGGLPNTRIEDNVDWLKTLVAHAEGKLTILIGGGVTAQNYEALAKEIGVTEVHGTRICW